MPLREFRCDQGHVTEKVLFGEEDKTVMMIECPVVVDSSTSDAYYEYEYTCGQPAARVEFSTVNAQFVEGVGGFYKPSYAPTPTTHQSSIANEMIEVSRNKQTKRLTRKGEMFKK